MPLLRLHWYKQHDIIPRREDGGQRVDGGQVSSRGRLLLYHLRKLRNMVAAVMVRVWGFLRQSRALRVMLSGTTRQTPVSADTSLLGLRAELTHAADLRIFSRDVSTEYLVIRVD